MAVPWHGAELSGIIGTNLQDFWAIGSTWYSPKTFQTIVFSWQQNHFQGSQCNLRATMLWGTCDFLFVTDRPALRLGDNLRQRGLDSGMKSLLAYSSLSKRNLDANRINYKIRPKWCPGKKNMCFEIQHL